MRALNLAQFENRVESLIRKFIPVKWHARIPVVLSCLLACFFAAAVTKDSLEFRHSVFLIMTLVFVFYLKARRRIATETLYYFLLAYLPYAKVLFRESVITPSTVLINFFFILSLLGFFCFRRLKSHSRRDVWAPLSNPLAKPILLFWGIMVFSIFSGALYGLDYLWTAAIQFIQGWLSPMLLFFLTLYAVRDRERSKDVTAILIFVLTMTAFVACYAYVDDPRRRVGGIANDPNMVAAYFNYYMFLPVSFLLFYYQRVAAWGLLVPILATLRGLEVTFSRGGYLAAIAGFFAVVLARNRILFLIILIFAGVVLGMPGLLPNQVDRRLGSTFRSRTFSLQEVVAPTTALDASSEGRIHVWRAGIRLSREHPFTGIGFYRFLPTVAPYWYGIRNFNTHSGYLLFTAEMGVPQLLVFLWIIGQILWRASRVFFQSRDRYAKSLTLGVIGGTVGLLVNNIFINSLDWQEVMSYFWVLAALVIRLDRERGRAVHEPQPGETVKQLPDAE